MSTQRAKIERLTNLLGGEAPELRIGHVSISELARQVSTPCYIYNGDLLVNQIRRVRQALGPETALYYSLKANPSLGLCQIIAREGVGAEVASIGELILAREGGFPAGATIFAGPGKTDAELELSAKLGIHAVNVESIGELGRLSGAANRLGTTARVGLRINPAPSQGCPDAHGRRPSPVRDR